MPKKGSGGTWQPRPAHCTRVGFQRSSDPQDTEFHSHRAAVGHCGKSGEGPLRKGCEGVHECGM